jgi:hypothetical protein
LSVIEAENWSWETLLTYEAVLNPGEGKAEPDGYQTLLRLSKGQ